MLTVLQPQGDANAPLEGMDHLFLLPERALTMDSARLQKDLAGLDFDPRVLHGAPMGNVWLSGAVDSSVKHNRPSSAHRARNESSEERELRLKMLREKQNEERQKKLEELKAQALAAQQFREMKEQERRRRIEELRVRENDRRQQVGERKRLIFEAEKDRRESILKKNQEREARFETKRKNERGSLAFAFGSSTPRMLEPADTGGSFWGYRRATSTNNIMFSAMPLTRRSSERELDGSKKRATSAGGLDRNNSEGNGDTAAAGCVSGHVGRRRTDLMPTIPLREAAALTPVRKPFTKSPGRAYSMSRLDQLSKPRKRPSNDLPAVLEHSPNAKDPKIHLQSSTNKSMSRSMGHLAVTKLSVAPPAPQRPLRKSDSRSMHQLLIATAPMPPPRTTRAVQLRKRVAEITEGPSRPGSSLSQQSTSSVSSTVNIRSRPVAAPRKPRPASIAVTGITQDTNKNIVGSDILKKNDVTKPPLPKTRKPSFGKLINDKTTTTKTPRISPKVTPKATPLQSPCTDVPVVNLIENLNHVSLQSSEMDLGPNAPVMDIPHVHVSAQDPTDSEVKQEQTELNTMLQIQSKIKSERKELSTSLVEAEKTSVESEMVCTDSLMFDSADMSASMIAKVRITTEEQAKAALAERRRLAREEAERLAEAERLRIEQEEERQRQEEEQLRNLAEEQRRAEDERLAQAIKETQKREEEEKCRQEEELKQKLEKEEQDKKTREENEKKKVEMEERLKLEESEREARRKRVEAIMLRTRAKGSPGNQMKNDNGINEKNSPTDENKANVISIKPTIESYEKTAMEKEEALFNGSFRNPSSILSQEKSESPKEPQHSNGHQNGLLDNPENITMDNNLLIQHNVTNTILALSELDSFKNTNATLNISTDKITNEDNVNSNNPKDSQCTTDLLL